MSEFHWKYTPCPQEWKHLKHDEPLKTVLDTLINVIILRMHVKTTAACQQALKHLTLYIHF